MLLETTSPTRVLRVARSAASTADGSGGGWAADACSTIQLFLRWCGCVFRAFRENGFNSRHIATQQTQPARLFELAALLLQTQMQTLLAQVALLRQKLVRANLNDFFDLHVSLSRRHVVRLCHPDP